MKITEQSLETLLIYIAQAIESRSDGDHYLPIFERIKKEIACLKAKNSIRAEVSRIAAQRSSC
ncbi:MULTISPECIES: hypothetical protein [Halocynthiibacter]|uniref:Uncharacterized protein n=1 Tax=Halocynthiibacter halioticoli TaxID=2986804 RepID=A0AAE3J0J5_9RHOB|nr:MULTISPECIES: hypothetical protein [Halocynthiibacter]MCV6825139.1 hypothetical protein [Halocynthiibacter halioticoli]MCW4058140.1 hypothetical protein [Halocynthiibacter sp. SDUM655004]